MMKAALALALVTLACGKSDPDPVGTGGAGGAGGRGGQGGRATGGAGPAATGGGGGTATGGAAGGTGTGGAAGAPAVGGSGGTADGPSGETPAAEAGTDTSSPPMGNPFVYVGNNGTSEIRIYELDLGSGALMPRGSATSGPNPHYMAFHPSGKFAYALSEVTSGRVYAFSVNAANGALARLNDQSSGGDGPAHISMHKSGKWLLAANYDSGHAAALPVMEDGRLGPPVQPRLAGAQAHMIIDDGQSGNFVFVPSKGDRKTVQFRFDVATGVLTPNSPPSIPDPGPPRHMSFHRSGKWAYMLTEGTAGGHTVVAFKYDPATGLLTDGARFEAAPAEGNGDGAHILVHPTKDFVYASLRFYDTIALFRINADGRLTTPPVQYRQQVARPWDFDIDPTGQYLVMGNFDTNNLKVLRIDQTTGTLTNVGQGASGPKPRFVGIMPRPR